MSLKTKPFLAFFLFLAATLTADSLTFAADDAGLAQDLSNPIADLITVPIQMNFDDNYRPTDDGWKLQTNIQPVIPFTMNDDWNIITRTIMPVIYQEDIFVNSGSQFGLGDINMSLFFSPKKPTSSGLIWGVGPVALFPTATESELGGEKWGAGPSAVVLTMKGGWTMGSLGNHIWSFAGDSDRQDINNTFFQPFLAYTWPNAWGALFNPKQTITGTQKNGRCLSICQCQNWSA